MPTAAQLKKQRHIMKKQLGLTDFGDGDGDDLIVEADLKKAAVAPAPDPAPNGAPRQSPAELLQELPGLSVRERNKRKRQAKAIDRNGSGCAACIASCACVHSCACVDPWRPV